MRRAERWGSSNGTERFFDGEIREVSLWNTSLTAAQVASVYSDFDESYRTIYTYDDAGRLTSLTDAVGNTTSYTYDYRGLVLSETNENLDTRYYSYDALGRLIEKTDRNNRVTTYTYDTMGRLTSEKWLDANDAVLKTFTYTYDVLGNLLTASDGEHSYAYTYDALNRVQTNTFTFDGQTTTFAYTYDAAGRQTASTLTLNNVATRTNTTTYDQFGQVSSIRQTGSAIDEIFAEFSYNANGLLTSVNRYEVDADNVATSVANSIYEYNANNAVTSITHNNSSGTPIVKHSYTYDSTNNIVEYLNSLDGNTTYDYDFLGQLISADYANTTITDESYTYDSNGNRVVANGSNYTTSTNNELTSDGSYTYTYDDEGNRLTKTNSTNRELYEWDYRNRLTSVTKQEFNAETQEWTTVQIVEYTYDYNNVWIRKIIGNEKTIFIPENYQTTVQIDNNTITHHYLWTPNTQDKLLADVTNTEILWSLTDHLGTVRDIIQSTTTGIVTQAHVIYDAYGNIISCKNSEGQTVDNPLLFAYTGKAFDTSTSLQNNINRWYDATVGRWLSTDPIGFEGNDTNLYRYCKNSSIMMKDSLGLQSNNSTSCCPGIFDAMDEQLAILQSICDILANQSKKFWELAIKLSVYEKIWTNRNNILANQNSMDDLLSLFGIWEIVNGTLVGVAEHIDSKTVEKIIIDVERDKSGRFKKRSDEFLKKANAHRKALDNLKKVPVALVTVGIASNGIARIIDILSTARLAESLMDTQTKVLNLSKLTNEDYNRAQAAFINALQQVSLLRNLDFSGSDGTQKCESMTSMIKTENDTLNKYLSNLRQAVNRAEVEIFSPASETLEMLENLTSKP